MLANRIVMVLASKHPYLVIFRQSRHCPIGFPLLAKDRRIVQNVAQQQHQDRLPPFERPESRKELAGDAGRTKIDENQIRGVGQSGLADDTLSEVLYILESKRKTQGLEVREAALRSHDCRDRYDVQSRR